MSQYERIRLMLEKQGFVSRNYFLDVQYDKILRMGAIIKQLRNRGYAIKTEMAEKDCIYRLIGTPDSPQSPENAPRSFEKKKFEKYHDGKEWRVREVIIPSITPMV